MRRGENKEDGSMSAGSASKSALGAAARLGWLKIVRNQLTFDPLAIYQCRVIGKTPLHWASHNEHLKVVTSLLDAGAKIEADENADYAGKYLHWGAEHEPRVVEILIERGADTNNRNVKRGTRCKGFSPLINHAMHPKDCHAYARHLLRASGQVLREYGAAI